MLVAFLDKLSGFLDRRFMLAFWAPMFLFFTAGATLGALAVPEYANLFARWSAIGVGAQALLAAGGLLVILVAAYFLQAFQAPVFRWYEGYWPAWLKLMIAWAQHTQAGIYYRMERYAEHEEHEPSADNRSIFSKGMRIIFSEGKRIFISIWRKLATRRLHSEGVDLAEQMPQADTQIRSAQSYALYFRFPTDKTYVRPTRLGNAMTAAEEYAFKQYGIDTVLWWPRLAPLLPETFRAQVDTALTPLLSLLNLSTLLALLGVSAAITAVFLVALWLLVTGVVTVLLARFCYLAAVVQATDYGQHVRVAFDLYRHEVLKQMHIPLPKSLEEESALWEALSAWVFTYTLPAQQCPAWPPPKSELPARRFKFDYADSEVKI